MKKVRNMKTYLTPTAAAVALALTAGSAHALDVHLAAKAFDKALPDGSTVPMWGYVEDSGGGCFIATAADGPETVIALVVLILALLSSTGVMILRRLPRR